MGKKTSSIKFHVVHRSDRDPLIADEASSKFVLKEVDCSNNDARRRRRQLCAQVNADQSSDEDKDNEGVLITPTFREQLDIPIAALPSVDEESNGILERDGVLTGSIHLAPKDVQKALLGEYSEDDFDELEDDFMEHAMLSGSDDYSDDLDDEDDLESEVDSDVEAPIVPFIDNDDDVGSLAGTDEAIWQQPISRPGGLGEIDDAFEAILTQYDSDEIGELDGDVYGVLEDVDDQLMDDFIVVSETKYIPGPHISAEADETIDITTRLVSMQLIEEEAYNTSDDDRAIEEECRPEERDQWDCESILSTRTNVENHPTMIVEPRKDRIRLSRRGIPLDDIDEGSISKTESLLSMPNLGVARSKKETAEEKRIRKALVRETRVERRAVKKEMRQAFSAEELSQHRSGIVQRHHNAPVIKF